MATKYTDTLLPQVIYVFRICDEDHKGCLKIGMSKLTGDVDITNLPPNCDVLNKIAKDRIDDYTATAATHYELLHTECSLFFNKKGIGAFDDHQVHEILLRTGIHKKEFSYNNKAREWFITDLQTVKNAIEAAKQGRKSLSASEVSFDKSPIEFRPEQRLAIDKSVKKFQVPGTRMLWNCKMRFGKTLSALQVVKEMQFHRTLIVTHRPVVDEGWFEDYDKIFYDLTEYHYSSKNRGEDLEELVNLDKSFIYFASMQDLRGSSEVGGNFDKNESVLNTNWDLLIIDEAHEGTQTELGQKVLKKLKKKKTCVINLSGTPFNIVTDFNEDEIVNWTYVDEQKAKENWAKEHPCDYNPYGGLPHMNMAIYDLNEVFDNYEAESGDVQFNFREFFRVWTGEPAKDHRRMPKDAEVGKFIHEDDVKKFLDLLVKPGTDSNYPFSTKEYRDIFRHTFWIVPGVAAAKALSALLKEHDVFSMFEIVNVAGDGDEDDEKANEEALQKVKSAITDKPEETYTITLSCGKLTTGVSVKAWTGVFMLYGAKKTKAQTYMQTIFRVQTPATIGGKRKEECYVFDFAPDRIITAIDETIRVAAYAQGKPGTQKAVITDEEREDFEEYLHYCSVIAYDGSQMREYNVNELLEHLKRVQIDRVVRNGFEDDALYNNDFLMNLDESAIKELENLKGIIGTSKAQGKMGDFVVNDQGLDDEPAKPTKSKKELSEEEKARKKELAAKKKKKKDAISILRGISIRLPLLIYGADVKDEAEGVTLDNFTSFVDKKSWEEFMPQGVTMQKFLALRKYYDPDIFRACGKKIRRKALDADSLPVLQRIHRITDIFRTFKNPDKETVLTPWRVVNMHLSDTVGGFDFYDEDHLLQIDEPRYVDRGRVTYRIFEQDNPRILEINSKSGLYPLYMAFSIYQYRLKQWGGLGLIEDVEKPTTEEQLAVWDDVVGHNIFVLCKTPMAERITKRTLLGFRESSCNIRHIDNLIEEIQNNQVELVKKIKQGKSFWRVKNESNMVKFDAVVGNPPYQVMQSKNSEAKNNAMAGAVYHNFIDLAQNLDASYISLITPSRWMTDNARGIPANWVTDLLKKNKISLLHDFLDASVCFDNVEIKGGVSYFLMTPTEGIECEHHCYKSGGEHIQVKHKLDNFNLGIVIRDLKAYNIIRSILAKEPNLLEDGFKKYVSSSKFFTDCAKGILTSNWKAYSKKRTEEKCIKYYLNKNLEAKGFAWISESDIPRNKECAKINKIFIPQVGGSGNDAQILGKPFIGGENSVCSETYICIGYDTVNHNFSEEVCMNIISYIKTRFFRFMVSLLKRTHHAERQVYTLVPDQNFSHPWTDEMLYEKYGLTEDEINYVESMINPMDVITESSNAGERIVVQVNGDLHVSGDLLTDHATKITTPNE